MQQKRPVSCLTFLPRTFFFLGFLFIVFPLIFFTDVLGSAFFAFPLTAAPFTFFSFFVFFSAFFVLVAGFFAAIFPLGLAFKAFNFEAAAALKEVLDVDGPPNFLTRASISFAIPPTCRARTSEAYTYTRKKPLLYSKTDQNPCKSFDTGFFFSSIRKNSFMLSRSILEELGCPEKQTDGN